MYLPNLRRRGQRSTVSCNHSDRRNPAVEKSVSTPAQLRHGQIALLIHHFAVRRSKILLPLHATRLFIVALSQTAAARVMHENLWLPVLIGLSSHSLALPALLLMKDPRHVATSPSPAQSPTTKPTTSNEVTAPLLTTVPDIQPPHPPPPRDSQASSLSKTLHNALSLLRDPLTAHILAIIFWNEMGHGLNNIIQQWISKTFSWSLANTNYFLSSQRAVAGITLILLAMVAARMQAAGVPSQRIDVRIIWFSQIVTVIGTFGVAASGLSARGGSWLFVGCILVYMMGWGIGGAVQSTVAKVVEKERLALVYVGLNIAERAGSILSAPVYTGLLAEGLRKEGRWVYLPFYVSCGVFVVVCALTMRLTLLLARL